MASELFLVDYIIICIGIGVTAIIGCYHAFYGNREATTKKYILADRNVHFIAIALSMVVSFQSSASVLGSPNDTYKNGPLKVFYSVSRVLGNVVSAFVFFPLFYKLKVTSVYEYIEIRYKVKVLKIIGAVTFIIQMMMYLAVVLYAPSFALNAVTGLDLWASVISLGLLCTLYTALGGVKAVIWTDVFQAAIMYFGLLAILIAGSIKEGGMSKVWQIAKEGGRTKLFDFDPDPRVTATTWTVCIGSLFNRLTIMGINQVIIQRAMSTSNLWNAQKAILLTGPVIVLWLIMMNLIGLVLYARYHSCNPMLTGDITAGDQIFALYVVRVLDSPGFSGLFVCVVFSAALSTFSSGLNSLAVVTWQDLLKEVYFLPAIYTNPTRWLKLLALIYGVLIMLLAAIFYKFQSILQSARTSLYWTAGPMLGLFTLGMFFKQANWKGGLAGWCVALIFQLWIGIGKFLVDPKPLYPGPPAASSECIANRTSSLTADSAVDDSRVLFYDLYRVSYLWHTMYSVLIVILVGVPVSYFTGKEDEKTLNPDSVLNYRQVFCPCRYKVAVQVVNDDNQDSGSDIRHLKQGSDAIQDPGSNAALQMKTDNIDSNRKESQAKNSLVLIDGHLADEYEKDPTDEHLADEYEKDPTDEHMADEYEKDPKNEEIP